jgi:4-hydroxy-3-methylbut-2-enyl diphosphate reductase IspH
MENDEPKPQYSEAEIKEENKRIRHLRRLVDFSLALIAQTPMSLDEAQRVVQAVREQAMRLFPGKEETFELLYTPRFRRLIAEKFGLL